MILLIFLLFDVVLVLEKDSSVRFMLNWEIKIILKIMK